MNNFIFKSPTELIFGEGQINKLGQKVLNYGGNKVLFVHSGGSIKSKITIVPKESIRAIEIWKHELAQNLILPLTKNTPVSLYGR